MQILHKGIQTLPIESCISNVLLETQRKATFFEEGTKQGLFFCNERILLRVPVARASNSIAVTLAMGFIFV